MPFQRVPNTVKIEMNALQNNVPVVNVYHAQLAAPPTDSDLEAIAQAMETWWGAYLQPYVHSSYVLQNITVTDLNVENGHQYVEVAITDPAGALGGSAAAANAAVVISWRTANTGRSFRGRTYIGGLAAGDLSNAQEISTTLQTNIVGAAIELIEALESVGAVLVVVSRFAAGVARVTALATEIINIIVDRKVDSQRRRTAN